MLRTAHRLVGHDRGHANAVDYRRMSKQFYRWVEKLHRSGRHAERRMDVYVIGYASHPPAEKVLSKRLEEMVYDTSAQALRAAAIERSELDHITIAACDELDGRSISNMLMVAPAGGYLKDELRVTDSAMVGLHLAAMRIASGRYYLGLLASWNKSSTAPFEDVMRMRCEPFFTRPIGLNATIADALFAQAQCAAGTASESKATAQSANLQRAAASNPRGLKRKAATADAIASSRDAAARRALRAGHRRGRVGGVGFRRMA
jgi:acetyl-CoA acetyltransferase